MATRSEIERLVETYYEDNGRYYSDVNRSGVKYFSMAFPTHVNEIEIDAFISDDRLTFECLLPTTVPKNKYRVMCEYLMQANDRFVGKFELDFDTGKVRIKEMLDYENIIINTKFIGECFYRILFNALKIIFGFVKIIYSDCSASDALEESLRACDDYIQSQSKD